MFEELTDNELATFCDAVGARAGLEPHKIERSAREQNLVFPLSADLCVWLRAEDETTIMTVRCREQGQFDAAVWGRNFTGECAPRTLLRTLLSIERHLRVREEKEGTEKALTVMRAFRPEVPTEADFWSVIRSSNT